jgi:hypothetical protein
MHLPISLEQPCIHGPPDNKPACPGIYVPLHRFDSALEEMRTQKEIGINNH